MSDFRLYLVTQTRTYDGRDALASALIANRDGLLELARRVCPLDHLHDTAEQAQACTARPVDTDCAACRIAACPRGADGPHPVDDDA